MALAGQLVTLSPLIAMSGIEQTNPLCTQTTTIFPNLSGNVVPLHRIAEVRRSQSLSLATVARRLHLEVAAARAAEMPQSDMLLSDLYQWRAILDVPVAELLIDPEELPSNPIRNRGQLLRMMKTVRTILESTQEQRTQILAQTLSDQMIELMPELVGVTSWPAIGQSREFKDYGQAVFRRFDSGLASALEEW